MTTTLKKILTVLCVFSASTLMAQTYAWTYRAGGTYYDDASSMHIGNDHNLLVTGMFQNTADFGTFSLTSFYSMDGFVAKYDDLGQVLWVKPINGDGGQVWGTDVTSDANNNVYVTGYFQSPSVHFTATDSLQRNPSSSSDVFVAKYNSNGVFQWAKSGAGTYSLAKSITCDNQGNVIISGSYNNGINFSGTAAAAGPTGVYMAKYNGQGNLLWVKSGTAIGQCWFNDLVTDVNNNIYATGKISSETTFDAQTIYNNGGDDLVIAKFDSNGDLDWMEVLGNTIPATSTTNNFDCGLGIALNSNGDIFVGGALLDTAIYGGSWPTIRQFAAIMKYDNNGNQQWLKKYGNAEIDIINDIALDGYGDPYVIGNYFDTLTIGAFSLTPQLTDNRAFMAKFDATTGDPIWATEHGTSSAGDCIGTAIQIHPITNNIYSAGGFQNTFNFGSNSVTSVGAWDMYLILNNATVGLADNENSADNLLVYPNPANTNVTLSLPTAALTDAQVIIYNLSGQVVLKQQLIDQQNVINVEALEAGNYIINIKTQDAEYHKKMVKL